MKKIIISLSAILLLFACQTLQPEIVITVESDLSTLIEAVKDTNTPLEDKLTAIEEAVRKGFADQKTADDLLSQAIESLSGTVEEKLAAIQKAISDPEIGLNTKLNAIQTAINKGFADQKTADDLISKAIETLSGSMEEKLAAIQKALSDPDLGLGTKLDLIQSAITNGFADEQTALGLIQDALDSLKDTQGGQGQQEPDDDLLEAINDLSEALDNFSVDYPEELMTKLQDILDAVEGIDDYTEMLETILKAVQDLQTSVDSLTDIVNDLNTPLIEKLDAIQDAVDKGFADQKTADDLISQAIETLGGTMEEKLDAISKAVSDPELGLGMKLDLIQAAITNGFADEQTALELIQEALDSLKNSQGGQSGQGGEAQPGQDDSSLSKEIAELKEILQGIANNPPEDLKPKLQEILDAVNGIKDYTQMLEAILQAIQDLELTVAPPVVHDYVDLGTGVKWATMNLGALSVEDYGYYYAWAETSPKTNYSWRSYKWILPGYDDWSYITKYTLDDWSQGAIWYNGQTFIGDGKGSFADYDYEDDPARQNWGGTWRVPTYEEFMALFGNNCYLEPVEDYEGTGVAGVVITSNVPGYRGNSIFLPFGGLRRDNYINHAGYDGYYWASQLGLEEGCSNAWSACFSFEDGDGDFLVDVYPRHYGLSIRPVCD